MEQVVSGVYTFTGLMVGRVYLITDGDGLTLIDASIPPAGQRILTQLANAGHDPKDLKRILITHAHPDHVGGIADIVAASGAQLIVPEGEVAVVNGEMPIPRAPTRFRPPVTVLENMSADRALTDNEVLPEVLGGLQALHTPGHAPGHMAYWQPERRILFCGDVIFHMWNMGPPFAFLTVDSAENMRSIGRLAALEPEVICFGHGKPIVKNAAQQLNQFARKVGAI